jgi:hypothetical protein
MRVLLKSLSVRLKAKRKKSTASLAEREAILEILEELTPLEEIRNYAPLKRGFTRYKSLQPILDKEL